MSTRVGSENKNYKNNPLHILSPKTGLLTSWRGSSGKACLRRTYLHLYYDMMTGTIGISSSPQTRAGQSIVVPKVQPAPSKVHFCAGIDTLQAELLVGCKARGPVVTNLGLTSPPCGFQAVALARHGASNSRLSQDMGNALWL